MNDYCGLEEAYYDGISNSSSGQIQEVVCLLMMHSKATWQLESVCGDCCITMKVDQVTTCCSATLSTAATISPGMLRNGL